MIGDALDQAMDRSEAVGRIAAQAEGYVAALRRLVERGDMSLEDAASCLADRALVGVEHPLRPLLREAAEARLTRTHEGSDPDGHNVP